MNIDVVAKYLDSFRDLQSTFLCRRPQKAFGNQFFLGLFKLFLNIQLYLSDQRSAVSSTSGSFIYADLCD